LAIGVHAGRRKQPAQAQVRTVIATDADARVDGGCHERGSPSKLELLLRALAARKFASRKNLIPQLHLGSRGGGGRCFSFGSRDPLPDCSIAGLQFTPALQRWASEVFPRR